MSNKSLEDQIATEILAGLMKSKESREGEEIYDDVTDHSGALAAHIKELSAALVEAPKRSSRFQQGDVLIHVLPDMGYAKTSQLPVTFAHYLAQPRYGFEFSKEPRDALGNPVHAMRVDAQVFTVEDKDADGPVKGGLIVPMLIDTALYRKMTEEEIDGWIAENSGG